MDALQYLNDATPLLHLLVTSRVEQAHALVLCAWQRKVIGSHARGDFEEDRAAWAPPRCELDAARVPVRARPCCRRPRPAARITCRSLPALTVCAAVDTRPRHRLQHLPKVGFQPNLIQQPPTKGIYVAETGPSCSGGSALPRRPAPGTREFPFLSVYSFSSSLRYLCTPQELV